MEINVSIFVGDSPKGSKVVQTPCVIGRSKEARLAVAHPAMSRKHCELYEEGGKLFLRDNSSLNGTLYMGEYVEEPVEIKFGEDFMVGELRFKISEPAGPLTPEQMEIVNRPTAAFSIDSEGNEEAGPGMATVLEAPKELKDLADETAADYGGPSPEEKPRKDAKKISPKDVQIKF